MINASKWVRIRKNCNQSALSLVLIGFKIRLEDYFCYKFKTKSRTMPALEEKNKAKQKRKHYRNLGNKILLIAGITMQLC